MFAKCPERYASQGGFAECPADVLELVAVAVAAAGQRIHAGRIRAGRIRAGRNRAGRANSDAAAEPPPCEFAAVAMLGRMRQVCRSWRDATFYALAREMPAALMRRLAFASPAALASPAPAPALAALAQPTSAATKTLTAARRACFAAAVAANNAALLQRCSLFGDPAHWSRSRRNAAIAAAVKHGHAGRAGFTDIGDEIAHSFS